MATKQKSTKKADQTLVDIVEVRDKAQNFLEENQKLVFGILVGLVVLVGGYFAYRALYKLPREREAIEQMFQAQVQFERDSFSLALYNPGGGYSGFADIAENYSGTRAGNLALYYAGISTLNLGQYDAAIDYLRDFDPEGDITPVMRDGALGDAYSEKGDFESAFDYYEKAANGSEIDLLSAYYLKKLGMLYEHQGRNEEALEAYQMLKDKYPTSPYASDIDKYIIRITPKG